MKRYAIVLFCLYVLSVAVASVGAHGATTGGVTRHDRDVIRFFHNHPKLARTPAGGAALAATLPRVVRSLQAADAVASAEAAWVNGSFATCVRWAESKNGAASENLYEIQGPNATRSDGDYEWLYGVSRAEQNHIAYEMYLARGVEPWAPYDGC